MNELPYHEELRQKYKPQNVNVLFVGESPPAGGTFFYAANSNLFYSTKVAFHNVYPESITYGSEFLEFFKLQGCYLDDLCLEPVNRKDWNERFKQREFGIGPLSMRIKNYAPKAVIVVMLDIKYDIKKAIERADVEVQFSDALPFPVFHKQRYEEELTEILERLQTEGIIMKL